MAPATSGICVDLVAPANRDKPALPGQPQPVGIGVHLAHRQAVQCHQPGLAPLAHDVGGAAHIRLHQVQGAQPQRLGHSETAVEEDRDQKRVGAPPYEVRSGRRRLCCGRRRRPNAGWLLKPCPRPGLQGGCCVMCCRRCCGNCCGRGSWCHSS